MIAVIATVAAMALPQDSDSLQARIEARIKRVPGAQVGLAYIDPAAGDSVFLNADSTFHAASTMKVPVMIELYRRAAAGGFAMNQGLLIVNRFASIADASPYSLDIASDSDTTLYERIGQRVPVDTLLRLMITRSSNLATNTLIALVGADQVTRTTRQLGATRMQVLRGVEDGKAFDRGLNNTTTARDFAMVLRSIESGVAASPAAAAQMRDILLAQEHNDRIPAGLPRGVRVAHKTGEITAHSHDGGIIYPPDRAPYVLVVLTRGIRDDRVASKLIADLSAMIYAHSTRRSAQNAAPSRP
jgi:beta-lactamase class A